MEWNHFLSKLLALSKIGLKFSKDPYALENYRELQTITLKQIQQHQTSNEDIVVYPRDVYPTPNISVRVLVFNDQQELLMVKESSDGGYAVPGGWCDVFESPSENAIKEVKQETNLDVKLGRLLAILQRERYKDSFNTVSEYVMYFCADIVSGELKHNHELLDIGFFSLNDIPELSYKVTSKELRLVLDIYLNQKPVHVD